MRDAGSLALLMAGPVWLGCKQPAEVFKVPEAGIGCSGNRGVADCRVGRVSGSSTYPHIMMT